MPVSTLSLVAPDEVDGVELVGMSGGPVCKCRERRWKSAARANNERLAAASH